MIATTNNASPEQVENARVGYQVAADLSAFYGGAIWSMFNAMLVANSIVVAGATFVIVGAPSLSLLKVLLPIVGILLCVTWFLLVKRAHEYSAYYILSAREIEERFLRESLQTLSRGGAFGSGKTVVFEFSGERVTRRMSRWGRLLRNEFVSYLIILIFMAVYIGFLSQI